MDINQIKELPRLKFSPTKGVYFLFNGDVLVYIGQSTTIESRVKQHTVDKVFDSYSFLVVEDNATRLDLESFLILKHNPPYNATVPNKKLVSLRWFCHHYDVDYDTIIEILEQDGVTPKRKFRHGDEFDHRYLMKDLAPYVNRSLNETKKKRTFNYVEELKKQDAGRNILQHHTDAKRLMMGEPFNKPMFIAIMRATTYYQNGHPFESAVKLATTKEVDVPTLCRLLTKEEDYLDNKKAMFEEIKNEVLAAKEGHDYE